MRKSSLHIHKTKCSLLFYLADMCSNASAK